MKLKLISALAVGVALLSGCAGRIVPMNSTNVKRLSNHDVYMCAAGLKIPSFMGSEWKDNNGLCYNEVNSRLASNKITTSEANQYKTEAEQHLPLKQKQDEAKTEQYEIETASSNDWGDQLNALEDCTMAPIACRVHVMNADLTRLAINEA